MKVLIACEESQTVCKAFRAKGHESFSCDIEPCSGGHPEWHLQGDAIKALHVSKWDLVIAHPPCTTLTNAGVRWIVSKKPREGYTFNEKINLYVNYNRLDEMQEGCSFFNKFVLYGKTGGKIVIENPIQHKYAKELINDAYSQIIQPYQFGHLETKGTCLWVYGVPLLKETNNVYDEMMKLDYKDRSKVHYASPGPDRAKIRSKTYQGIADAMAEQWG